MNGDLDFYTTLDYSDLPWVNQLQADHNRLAAQNAVMRAWLEGTADGFDKNGMEKSATRIRKMLAGLK